MELSIHKFSYLNICEFIFLCDLFDNFYNFDIMQLGEKMRLIEKMLKTITTLAVASAVCTVVGGVAALPKEMRDISLKEEQLEMVNQNGYLEANEKNKQNIMNTLVADYQAGKMTSDEINDKLLEAKITELDVDEFARNNLDEIQLKRYNELSQQIEEISPGEYFVHFGLGILLVDIAYMTSAPLYYKIKSKYNLNDEIIGDQQW